VSHGLQQFDSRSFSNTNTNANSDADTNADTFG